MKRSRLRPIFCLFLAMLFGTVSGQHYQKNENGVSATVNDMNIKLEFYAPQIIRVVKTPVGVKCEDKSFSVIKTPDAVPFEVREYTNSITLKSDSMCVYLNLRTGKVSYTDRADNLLLAEKDYGTQFTPIEYGTQNTFLVRQAFKLDKNEAIYGLGQHQKGKMNQRNQMVHLRQDNTITSIPFFQSEKGYGVLWDNASVTKFTDNPAETAFDSEAGACANYYFMAGKNADAIIGSLRDLTGQVQMNPLWTYGFWQSKERYQSQDELVGVVKKYRDLKVPLDGIIQDWQYWGTDMADWNSTEFNNPLFPNPKQMIDDVHNLNAHIAISVWPAFGTKTGIYKTFKDKDMLLDMGVWPEESKLYDPFNPEARDIYWEHLNKNIFSLGMDAWWLDATEPESPESDKYRLTQDTYAGQFNSVANAFPIATVGGVYDHQRKVTSDKRVYIFTRSAFTGQQRYGANSWSGDVKSSWADLRKQIPAGLNFSLCGIPYWNTDIGGFASCNYFPDGIKDPEFRELYVRWNQFGAFTPMMRSHGTCTPREIYQFGDKGSWEFDAIEKYIKLRYDLLPYIYSTAWSVTKNNDSFMRALFMDFNNDTNVHNIDDQFMFGRSFLIAPVTESMYVDKNKQVNMDHTKSRSVYLPKGSDWFDFWTNKKLVGGQTVSRETPIDIIPMYVKSGSIVPMGPKVQYATEKRWDNMDIRIYPGANGTFVLYEDENDNYNYENGFYSTITFQWDDQKKELTIGERNGDFKDALNKRQFNLIFINNEDASKQERKTVNYVGKQINVKF